MPISNSGIRGAVSTETTFDGPIFGLEENYAKGFVTAGSSARPANSAVELRDKYGVTQNGVYYIKFNDGSVHPILCDMTTSGGGWMNINVSFGPYSSALTSSWGTGGGNYLSGLSGNSTTALNSPNVTNSQATTYGCSPPDSSNSKIILNSSLKAEKSLTEVIVDITSVSDSGCTCGYTMADRAVVEHISGNSWIWSTCAGAPNDYSGRVANGDSAKGRFSIDGENLLLKARTACGGSFVSKVNQLWVR